MSGRRETTNARPARSAVALAAVALLAAGTAGATELSGDLSGRLGPGLYRIVGDIAVPPGETLILDPGVVFEFDASWWEEFEFDVRGILLAVGTAAQPIIFRTAPGVSEWNYLRLRRSESRLRHCRIERVGNVTALAEGGLWIDGCSPLIEQTVVTAAAWHAIYVTGSGARPLIRWTQVHGNAIDGIDADRGAGLELRHCTVRGNGGDGVCLAAGGALLVNCLITENGEDGVDSQGLDDGPADLVHCTIARNGSENLSDAGAYRLYNSLVLGSQSQVAACTHSYVIGDPAFLGFVNASAGNYRLRADSPCRESGTPFLPAGWLPVEDLDGRSRRNGLLDLGAYECPDPPPSGASGTWFSRALLSPRLTQPEILRRGESLTVRVAATGLFSPEDARLTLISPEGIATVLPITQVTPRDAVPGSEWETRFYLPGIERIQELRGTIPAGAPTGLCDLEASLGDDVYRSLHAVQVLDEYPSTWSFVHVTDTHVGYDEEAYSAAERLRIFVREANALNPAFVVITGDICENQNLENEAWVDTFLAASAGFRVPLFVLPGNHDFYNESGLRNPYGYFRYFQEINRTNTAEIRFGPARLYALNSRHELGVTELYRCAGPSGPSLDWVESRLQELDPGSDQPRFFLMHGPNYDYFAWNGENTARVRDLMQAYGVSLCLAGHTHRFETFRNEGDNWFGRNDYDHENDWDREVPFPGFPLHVQTSSLGKEARLLRSVPPSGQLASGIGTTAIAAFADSDLDEDLLTPHRRGIFGDDIGYRVVRVANGEVSFFTCDTDGDGYRNTEDAWLLGELSFSRETLPGGILVSRIRNQHHETWTGIRHYIPADPGAAYAVAGGALVRRWTDGTVEVAVEALGPAGESWVTLTPLPASIPRSQVAEEEVQVLGNPFRERVTFRLSRRAGENGGAPALRIIDCAGREVRRLDLALSGDGGAAAGSSVLVHWDGRDESGRSLPAGVYFARLDRAGDGSTARLVKLAP